MIARIAVIAADELDYAHIQLVYLAVLLKDVDEHSRREQSVIGILPPRKSLKANDRTIHSRDDRLVEYLDIAVFYRVIYVVDDVLPEREALLEILVIQAIAAVVVLLYAVAGKTRLVAGVAYLVAAAGLVRTALERELYLALKLLYAVGEPCDDLHRALLLGQDNEVVIGISRNERAAERFIDVLCKFDEELIALRETVLVVVGLEILYIKKEDNGVLSVRRDVAEELFALGTEVYHIVYAGQLVLDRYTAEVGVYFLKVLVLSIVLSFLPSCFFIFLLLTFKRLHLPCNYTNG